MSGCAHEVTLMQGSLFYPTRNFATLGIVVTRCSSISRVTDSQWVRSFLPDSACRHTDRTVSSPAHSDGVRCMGAWRAVSEDPIRISSRERARCLPDAFIA